MEGQPWDDDPEFKYIDDTPLLDYVLSTAQQGFYKITTNAYGQVIALIPNYIDFHTYTLSNYELKGYQPNDISVDDLVTHVYVQGSKFFYIPEDMMTSWADNTIGASLITDEFNWGLVASDTMFSEFGPDFKELIAFDKKLETLQKQKDNLKKKQTADKRQKGKRPFPGGEKDSYVKRIQDMDNQIKDIEDKVKNATKNEQEAWKDIIKAIDQKFGKRIEVIQVPFLNTLEQVTLQAHYYFREFWFKRYSANFNCTFLPTLRPLHRVLMPTRNRSYYVERVHHTMFSSWTTTFPGTAGKYDNGEIPEDVTKNKDPKAEVPSYLNMFHATTVDPIIDATALQVNPILQ